MASIQFGADELKPLIEQVVREVMATIGTGGSRRLAYTEDEAAALLGLHPKQLAEARRLGKVRSFRVGKTGVRYSRRALERFIEQAEGGGDAGAVKEARGFDRPGRRGSRVDRDRDPAIDQVTSVGRDSRSAVVSGAEG